MRDTALIQVVMSAQLESFTLEVVAHVIGQKMTTTTTTTKTTRRSSTSNCMLVNDRSFFAPRSSFIPEILIITL